VKGYTCDPEVRTFNCVDADLPTHSEWSGLSGYEQTWDGTVFSPVDSDPTYGAGVA
jgi:hypothetical protein